MFAPVFRKLPVLGFYFMTACSITEPNFAPPVDLPETFSVSGSAATPDKWWQSFNDPALNDLVEKALDQNLDLRATFDRLEQAKSIATRTGAELIPSINGLSGINNVNRNGPDLTSSMNDFSLALAASYEVDLWGRIRAGLKAAELDVQSAEQDIHTAAIALTAEIAGIWYQLTEQQKLYSLLSEQIKINEQYADLVNVRFRGGQATAADVYQQMQLLEGVIGDRFAVMAFISVLQNQLAVLSGQAPGQFKIKASEEFPDINGLPTTGLTSEFIQRRPDIKKAYFRLQAADLRVASAVADRFPKISLAAGITTTAPDLQSFFNNWMSTLAGNLVIPIIDGSRRFAEVDRNKALTAEAFNLYGQRILQSIKEVENALAQETQQHQRLESLEKQLKYLTDANADISIRSAYGAFDFLRILSTLNSLQSMQRTMLRAKKELVDYRINLYRSLAGGWSVPHSQS